MYLRTLTRLALIEPLRAMLRNKIRSGLAMLGITSAVATVIWVLAIGHAGTAGVLAALDQLGDNLVWVEAGSRNTNGVRSGSHGMTTLVPRDAEAIRLEVPLIANVSENVDGRVQIVSPGGNWSTQFRGVAPGYLTIRSWVISRGRFLEDDDVRDARTVLVIGETVREKLFGDDDPLGARVRVGSSVFEIVGLLGTKGQSATGQDQDDTIMMPWTTAMRRIVGNSQTWLDDILCSAVSTEAVRDAGVQVSALLRDRHRIRPGGDDDFNIRHPEDLLQARLKSAHTLQLLLASLALLALLIGGIGIMNVMLAAVSQRTREIGLRMAVGASPMAIHVQFLAEAMVISTLSGALGVALGVFGAPWISDTLGWELAMSREADVLAIGFAVATGAAFGIYPALRAARLDPIAALRVD